MPAAFDAESMVLAWAELKTNLDLVSAACEIIQEKVGFVIYIHKTTVLGVCLFPAKCVLFRLHSTIII